MCSIRSPEAETKEFTAGGARDKTVRGRMTALVEVKVPETVMKMIARRKRG